MSIEVKVPQLPESVTDATLAAWHKKAGERVRRDENLVDLETDKVVLEVPAPSDGVLKEIAVTEGTVVTSGQLLAKLEPGEAAAEPAPGAAEPAESTPAAAAERKAEPTPAAEQAPRQAARPDRAAAEPARPAAPSGAATPERARAGAATPERPRAGTATPIARPSEKREPKAVTGTGRADENLQRMGPAARKLLEEHDLDAAEIEGTGREGRITKSDVLEYIAAHGAATGLETEAPATPAARPAARAQARAEHRVAMTRLRQRIAERLVEAQQEAAMLTTFNEVDMSAVIALRARYQEQFQARYDIKLGFMSFFVRAAIEALRQFPQLNASIDGKDIIYHEFFDVGVAVSTDRGLVVPVLRNAESLSFAEIEQTIRDFGQRARRGELGMDDLTGGTFTITNGGIFGSLMSTPILNPPQSGILGMHKIQERPVVVNGSIEARPMMYLALTYDHRIVDGREAVQCLVHLKEQIEDPARLMLQV